jgi:predicted DNA-binding protein
MSINRKDITKEMLAKAVQCRNANELIALAKTRGMEMTREEAEAYMAELADFELDADTLQNVAGGGCYSDCKAEAWL